MKKIVALAALVSIFAVFSMAFAQATPQTGTGATPQTGTGSGTLSVPNPLGCPDLKCVLFDKAIPILTHDIAPAIVTLMVLIGAFQILTANGHSEKITKGRHTIVYAAIGFGIVLLANAVGLLVQDLLGSATSPVSSSSSGSPSSGYVPSGQCANGYMDQYQDCVDSNPESPETCAAFEGQPPICRP